MISNIILPASCFTLPCMLAKRILGYVKVTTSADSFSLFLPLVWSVFKCIDVVLGEVTCR